MELERRRRGYGTRIGHGTREVFYGEEPFLQRIGHGTRGHLDSYRDGLELWRRGHRRHETSMERRHGEGMELESYGEEGRNYSMERGH